ncbi:hypothetical protein ACJRO7_034348 [Eucalyptus globulus]|uniref:Uncharacterized protein n=1 Tax=Eucalyptus globulus TaxID=34317 RepID=A0ABD3J786_EUCGL
MRVIAVVVIKDGGFIAAAIVVGVGVIRDVGVIVGVKRGHAKEGPYEKGRCNPADEEGSSRRDQAAGHCSPAHPLHDWNVDHALPRASGFMRDPQYLNGQIHAASLLANTCNTLLWQ